MAQQHAESNPFADLDSRLEEIFEKADDYMINKKSYKDAVSAIFHFLLYKHYSATLFLIF